MPLDFIVQDTTDRLPLHFLVRKNTARWVKVVILGQAGGHANHGLHPTRLSLLEIGGHTRFQGILWRGLPSRTRAAGEAGIVTWNCW